MKLSIAFDNGNLQGTEREFHGDRVVRLGRHGENDIIFEGGNARTVSGFHAEIHMVGRRVTIIDNHSTNGVLVNGQWAERTVLSPGDMVELGKDGPTFRVLMEVEATDPPPRHRGMDFEDEEESVNGPVATVREKPISESPFRPYAISRANTLFPHAPHDSDAPETVSERPQKKTGEDQEERSPEKPEGSPPEKKYGDRTVGMMIQKALSGVGGRRSAGTSKSTDYFEALVEQKVRSSSSRLKRALLVSVGLLLLVTGAVGFYLYRTRNVQVYQTTQTAEGSSGQSIAAANRFAVFMLAGKERVPGESTGRLQGFCTSFAVTRDVLATNAHCVMLVREKYSDVVAIMNGAPDNTFWITNTVTHTGYVEGRISPDVGLLKIKGELPNLVSIAPVNELGQVTAGATMFLYGFPGRLNREDAPEATFVQGDIGRVTTFAQTLGDFGQNTLLQHSAFSTGGTSGSPIFNGAGHVIGINAGGYMEEGKSLAGYNFAMRIDLINVLLPVINGRK